MPEVPRRVNTKLGCRVMMEFTCQGTNERHPMINGKRIAVVMPAYNAENTLEATVREIPDLVDIRILVDDYSKDKTVEVARRLGLTVFVHDRNLGYGGNQQTCYREALAAGADVVVMVHPDYQYTPLLTTALASMVAYDVYDVVLGSRIIGGQALRGGMPLYKYIANRFLTAFENLFLRVKLSEYHTGYRAFNSKVLTTLPLMENSQDFVFDNQMLAQCVYFGFRIGEVSCPTKYFEEASSINFRRSVKYGLGVLLTSLQFAFSKWGLAHLPRFSPQGKKLPSIPSSPPRSNSNSAGPSSYSLLLFCYEKAGEASRLLPALHGTPTLLPGFGTQLTVNPSDRRESWKKEILLHAEDGVPKSEQADGSLLFSDRSGA